MPSDHLPRDVDAYLADPARKQAFVTPMFDIIAPRYDRFTRLFSFGMDRRWKDEMLAALDGWRGRSCAALDLACGTGDLAFDVAAMLGADASVTGVDASPKMIALARARLAGVGERRVRFEVGDMTQLDAGDSSVDIVTAGYGLRNVPDYRSAIAEIARVLRPGGTLVTLDFYRPTNAVWRSLFLGYLAAAGNVVGWAWHREGVVYGYIARSIDHFVSAEQFSDALGEAGFAVTKVSRKLLGGVAIHVARKR